MECDLEVHENKIKLEKARLALREFELKVAKKKTPKSERIETVKPEVIDTADVPLPPLYDFKELKPKDKPKKEDDGNKDDKKEKGDKDDGKKDDKKEKGDKDDKKEKG